MNYGITLKNKKIISDYVYSVYYNEQYFREDVIYLMRLIDEYGWIKCKDPRLVNPDHISFVTQDPDKNRIIINIASSISFHGNHNFKTSDFIYINCNTKDEYTEFLSSLRTQLDDLVL